MTQQKQVSTECPECLGSGMRSDEGAAAQCPACGGTGQLSRQQSHLSTLERLAGGNLRCPSCRAEFAGDTGSKTKTEVSELPQRVWIRLAVGGGTISYANNPQRYTNDSKEPAYEYVPTESYDELRAAAEYALGCLEPIDRIGHLPQGGESVGNAMHVMDSVIRLRRALERGE